MTPKEKEIYMLKTLKKLREEVREILEILLKKEEKSRTSTRKKSAK